MSSVSCNNISFPTPPTSPPNSTVARRHAGRPFARQEIATPSSRPSISLGEALDRSVALCVPTRRSLHLRTKCFSILNRLSPFTTNNGHEIVLPSITARISPRTFCWQRRRLFITQMLCQAAEGDAPRVSDMPPFITEPLPESRAYCAIGATGADRLLVQSFAVFVMRWLGPH